MYASSPFRPLALPVLFFIRGPVFFIYGIYNFPLPHPNPPDYSSLNERAGLVLAAIIVL